MIPAPRFVELLDPWLHLRAPGARFFTSLEGENPTGSLKDRMVWGELTHLRDSGVIQPGDCISEVSAGSTARSLAYFCKRLGLSCSLFVPDHMPPEQMNFLKLNGAELHPVDPRTAYEEYREFCRSRKTQPLNQLGDSTLSRHYHAFGALVQTTYSRLDGVVGSVGTGHSLLGTAAGFSGNMRAVTAEPSDYAVSGIRNLDLENHGEDDCCNPERFSQRIFVASAEKYPKLQILTDVGEIEISGSFQVVLGAVRLLSSHPNGTRFFLIGSSNRRVKNVGK